MSETPMSQLKELQVLYAVAQVCAEAVDEGTLVREVTRIIIEEHQLADALGVMLWDEVAQVLRIHPAHGQGWPYDQLPQIPLGQGITGLVARDQQVRYVPDTGLDVNYVSLGMGMGAELCVPLLNHGRVLGVINAERHTSHSFDPFAQRLLTTIASQLSQAMTRLASEENTQRYAQQLISMNQMAQKLTRTLELNELLQSIIDEVSTLVNAEGVGVLLVNETGEQLHFAAVSGPGSHGLQGYTLPVHQGIAGYVMRTGQPFAMRQRQEAQGVIHAGAESQSGFKAESLMAVPIIVEETTLGVLEAVHSQPQQFAPDALRLLQNAAAWAAIALRNAHLYQQVHSQYAQLQQSQVQLIQAEKLSALGRLMASIAHEVNNPIQGMQGCLTLATEELAQVVPDVAVRAEVDFYLAVVEKELVRVAALVERMRQFYQPARAGQYPTAVADILTNVLSLSQKQLTQTRVTLHTDITSNLPLVMANPDHLKQVFLNLLLNALEAMPDGGDLYLTARRAAKQEAQVVGQNTAVFIRFHDTGIGIAPSDYPQLFEPFFTTKPQGSGLGLPTSYNIIQAHSGHITVSSPTNGGTKVTIILPTA